VSPPPENANARRATGRSAEKNADAKLLRAKSSRVNNSYTIPVLTFWRNAPGVCRFQTNSPDLARKLSQRSKARLVAWSVCGGYLRIFQEPIEPWRAQRLVSRYSKATNGGFSVHAPRQTGAEPGARVKTAANSVRRCVACHGQVTNRNLGGHARRSALSGPVWCLQCADGGPS
jgi:hypothetical protein